MGKEFKLTQEELLKRKKREQGIAKDKLRQQAAQKAIVKSYEKINVTPPENVGKRARKR